MPQIVAIVNKVLRQSGQQVWMRGRIRGAKIIDWIDDGKINDGPLGGGKIAFRQMQWTHFRYRNFKVWSLDSDR